MLLGWYRNTSTVFHSRVFKIITFADNRVLFPKLAFVRQPGQARPGLFTPLLQKSGSCQRECSITVLSNLIDIPVSILTRGSTAADLYFYGTLASHVMHAFVRNMLSRHSLSIVAAWNVFPQPTLRQCELLRKIIVTHWSLVSGWQIFSWKTDMCYTVCRSGVLVIFWNGWPIEATLRDRSRVFFYVFRGNCDLGEKCQFQHRKRRCFLIRKSILLEIFVSRNLKI